MTTPEPHDPQADLLSRARDGDRVALKVLLAEAYSGLLQSIDRQLPDDLRRVIDAEDVLQEAEVDVFRHIVTFEPRGENAFFRWALTIALNRLRDAIRHHRAAKRGGDARAVNKLPKHHHGDSSIALLERMAGPGRTPSRSMARGEAIDAVQAALAELPEHHRQAVQLVHLEGRAIAEAAAEMGRTDRAVQGLCRRGLEQLEARLEKANVFMSR